MEIVGSIFILLVCGALGRVIFVIEDTRDMVMEIKAKQLVTLPHLERAEK